VKHQQTKHVVLCSQSSHVTVINVKSFQHEVLIAVSILPERNHFHVAPDTDSVNMSSSNEREWLAEE